jgi:type IV pilus assembly protein PilM
MKWKLLKKRQFPIGIDLGTAAAKLVQLVDLGGQMELTAAAYLDLPEELQKNVSGRLEFLEGRLGGLLRQGGFQGRKCVMSLPPSDTFLAHVRVPKVPSSQMEGVLRGELEGKLPFDVSQSVIRHLVAGEAEAGSTLEVIAVATPRRLVDQFAGMAERARLELLALDIEPCAILECFGRLLRRAEDAERATLFLDIGQSFSQVVIALGARMVFARNLPMGGRQIDQAVATVLNMPLAEVMGLRRSLAGQKPNPQSQFVYDALRDSLNALAGEITQCLRYYESVFPSHPVERSIFLGGGALDHNLCQQMAQRLNLPAQIGDPLLRIGRRFTMPAPAGMDRRQANPAWAVAVGLCLGSQISVAA